MMMTLFRRRIAEVVALVVTGTLAQTALLQAAVTLFPRNLAGFNTAAGNPGIQIDFDAIAPNTNITGLSFAGVTLTGPGAPLIVVAAASTMTPAGVFNGAPNPATNTLLATSGANVLSPGGATLGLGPAVENDDLTLTFVSPVSAFGFDHLSQSADGFSFTSLAAFDMNGVLIFSAGIAISGVAGGDPGGADFYGIVSDTANIARIVIDENDDDNNFPDANIGFDTFRFGAIPEPRALSVLLATAALLTRRRTDENARG